MPSSLSFNDATWIDQPGGKRGQLAYRASNGRMVFAMAYTGESDYLYLYHCLPSDTSITRSAQHNLPRDSDNQVQHPRFAVHNDELHVLASRYFKDWNGTTNHRSFDWELVDLTTALFTTDTIKQSSQNLNTGMGPPMIGFLTDSTAIIEWSEAGGFRTMGSNYDSPMYLRSDSGSWVWSLKIANSTTTSRKGHQSWYKGNTFYSWDQEEQLKTTISSGSSSTVVGYLGSNITAGYVGANLTSPGHYRFHCSESFYDSSTGKSHQLVYRFESASIQKYMEVEGDTDGSTTFTGAEYDVPGDLLTSYPAAFHYDAASQTSTIIYQKDGSLYMTKRVAPATTYSAPEVVYQHSGLGSYTNGKPVCIYDNGGQLNGMALFGATGSAEWVWDIPLVALGEADVDAALSRTVTRSLSGTMTLGGFVMAGILSKACTKTLGGTLFAPELGLTQGWESRYQANEAGQLLERNIYRAYVGATEFPLYSISASFSGLDAFTSDPSGSAYITLKAPISQREYLTSQVGQEFIVLNGVETAGVFQGVEFVRGTIDEVKAAGDFVVVSTSRTEQFSAGVVATIDTGIEFVSRQRIRFGRINPTLRPGARVITPRGTYDVAQLTYFVGPRQKFMEISAYG